MSKEKKEKKMQQHDEKISVKVIKEIFEEMFKEHQKNITDIIKKNMKTYAEQLDLLKNDLKEIKNFAHKEIYDIKNSVKILQNENNDLKRSIEMQEEILEKKISQLKDETEKQNTEITNLYNRQRIQEDRSRRNNIRIEGIREENNENWNETEQKMGQMLAENGINIANFSIERAHRIGQRKNGRPRTIVAKFLHFKDKQYVMSNAKKLKNTGIYINDDYSKETNLIRKDLSIKMWEKRKEGRYAYISYDRLIVRD